MDGTELGVGSRTFVKEIEKVGMIAMMFAGDVDLFTTDYDYLLAVE